jgi:hypothetical protein
LPDEGGRGARFVPTPPRKLHPRTARMCSSTATMRLSGCVRTRFSSTPRS